MQKEVPSMGSVTLKSVAEAAGVSVSTVSNAYNKPDQLSAEVRLRILETAKELGYAGPNPAARSLRSQRARAIGLVFTERLSYAFSDPYSVGMLAGLAEVAEQFQTGLLLIPLSPFDPERPEQVEASAEAMRAAVIDGVLAYCLDIDHPAREIALDRGLRMVATDDQDPRMDGLVLIDERGAARQVGEHIRRLGHRSVGIVVDSKVDQAQVVEVDDVEHRTMSFSWARYDGFREGLGPDVRVQTVAPPGHNSVEAGRAAGAHLLDQRDRPSAIIAVSDVLALGVLDAMRQRGLEPGRDVSLCGFDDVPAAADAGLTTVRQPIAERGRIAGRMLLDPDYTERRIVLPTELVVRSSTGPATTPQTR
ncbi:LacI family DNA-binding transcriptional regulator [Pedococcus dokdonensis]|nr:LacI family DNA-binding transcriptional regulator [Pedococcus dokdonensis]